MTREEYVKTRKRLQEAWSLILATNKSRVLDAGLRGNYQVQMRNLRLEYEHTTQGRSDK